MAATNNTIAEIRAIDSATGAETLLLKFLYPLGRGVSTPAYAADGLKILFSMTDGLGQWQIGSIPATGGPVTQLTQLTSGASAFAPESSRASANFGEIVFYQAFSSVHTMNADGSNPVQALTDPYSISDVHWTPEGNVAYLSTSFDSQGPHPHLHIPPDLDANGDDIADVLQPSGTPSGSFSNVVQGKTNPTVGTQTGGSATISDHADPTKGVRITAITDSVFSVCPFPTALELEIPAGFSVTVTCGSVIVEEVSGGPVTVNVPGTTPSVTFAVEARARLATQGGVTVSDVSGEVSLSVGGVSGTRARG